MHDLPKVAVLLANYLRQVTGDQNLFARVIGTDEADNPFDCEYIAIGQLWVANAEETLLFELTGPGSGRQFFTLYQIIDYPGGRFEPPSTDAKDIMHTHAITDVFARIARQIFRDRLGGVLECLAFDFDALINGDPLERIEIPRLAESAEMCADFGIDDPMAAQ